MGNSPENFIESFTVGSIHRLLINKHDPRTGDAWFARLNKAGAETTDWMIEGELVDHAANGALVEHLLDTLRLVRPSRKIQARGTLESFGLDPAFFALEWSREARDTRDAREFKLAVGDAIPQERAFYAQPGAPGAAQPGAPGAAQSGDHAGIYAIQGALPALLSELRGFRSLRQSHLLFRLESDDVDQIEVRAGANEAALKSVFYAQREGDHWGDRREKALSPSIAVDPALDALSALSVKEFVDSPVDTARLIHAFLRHPLAEAILTDRDGHPTSLRWSAFPPGGSGKSKVWAMSSERPGAIFEIEAIPPLSPMLKLPASYARPPRPAR